MRSTKWERELVAIYERVGFTDVLIEDGGKHLRVFATAPDGRRIEQTAARTPGAANQPRKQASRARRALLAAGIVAAAAVAATPAAAIDLKQKRVSIVITCGDREEIIADIGTKHKETPFYRYVDANGAMVEGFGSRSGSVTMMRTEPMRDQDGRLQACVFSVGEGLELEALPPIGDAT
jgi:hypothetical protein